MFIPSIDRDANVKVGLTNICSKTHAYGIYMETPLFLSQLLECHCNAIFRISEEAG